MSSDKRSKQMALITELAAICEELGWIVGVPASGDPNDDMVPGLIVGTKQFVAEIATVFSDGQNIDDVMESYESGNEVSLNDQEEEIPVLPNPNNNKKTTLH